MKVYRVPVVIVETTTKRAVMRIEAESAEEAVDLARENDEGIIETLEGKYLEVNYQEVLEIFPGEVTEEKAES